MCNRNEVYEKLELSAVPKLKVSAKYTDDCHKFIGPHKASKIAIDSYDLLLPGCDSQFFHDPGFVNDLKSA